MRDHAFYWFPVPGIALVAAITLQAGLGLRDALGLGLLAYLGAQWIRMTFLLCTLGGDEWTSIFADVQIP